MNTGNVIQVRLEGNCFPLLVIPAEQPLNRQGTWQQTNRDPRILKPVGGKTQMRLQPRSSKPMSFYDLSTIRAGHFHPAQNLRSSAAVNASEDEIPERYQDSRGKNIDEKQAPHNHSQMRMLRLRVLVGQHFQ